MKKFEDNQKVQRLKPTYNDVWQCFSACSQCYQNLPITYSTCASVLEKKFKNRHTLAKTSRCDRAFTSNGRTADTAHEKAECLNSVFADKPCVPNPLLSVPTLPTHTQLFLDCVSISSEKVESLLSNLDSDSAIGPDSISPRVLKTCSGALAHPRSVLFTLSFAQGHLPSAWKSANITALHKKGAKTDPCNCRPISLPPIISKVMESIIASDIKSFLFSNGLISDHQFGFRPGYSTLDMLLLLSQQCMEILNARHEITAISLDISCAFDTVWHPALLTKLSSYGVQGHHHSWLTGFLSCCSHRVTHDGVPSSPLPVQAGVH
uniref:Reverse transcriptase domain-containing protein n=1 Tax=Eptatretus burgeri TaxID=7764 RepID=A0A8C4PZN4_EPTBU